MPIDHQREPIPLPYVWITLTCAIYSVEDKYCELSLTRKFVPSLQ
jgi:hypothetical protein